ncbi:hypothetical protein [Methanospirillum lacunae]|uniref:Uncharacterized protein n=1 Tax=Methanospirillum lacunae TaxID=668570 RepID=A0A2V2NB19_9EURY|nr:hypothetical protein [Methanospirillum lacunae]PWR73678.1 hypothetical protein DK846_00455 [Methanospirillum lacunae]
MSVINLLLEEIDELDTDDQEYLIDILQNRLRDKRRSDLASRGKEALLHAQSGCAKTGSFHGLWADLNG